MIILQARQFNKKVAKLDQKTYQALRGRFRLFQIDPFHPLLDNHKLSGPRSRERSINITGDFRLIFEQLDRDTVRLIDIDMHHNLYGK